MSAEFLLFVVLPLVAWLIGLVGLICLFLWAWVELSRER